jgi:hypothetical protein
MSLDNRLRKELTEFASESPPKALDVGSDLQGVRAAGRRREVLHRAYRGIAIVALVLIAAFGIPSLLREFGSQEVNTADDPGIESNVDNGDTSSPSDAGDGSRPSIGGVGTGGFRTNGAGTPPAGQGAGTTRQESSTGQAGSPVISTPKPIGTYSYSVKGQACGGFYGCGDMKELKATYRQPNGSHQESSDKWTNQDGGRYEAEYSYDYRSDGVYFEHFTGALYNPHGVLVSAWACPELKAMPVRVWPAGTKPGDHFEYTVQCEGSSARTLVDIVRAETISVGGREVETFFVQSNADRRTTESWVYPSHLLTVKEHASWTEDYGGGMYRTMLENMTPS